ncbi:hypothetical protein C0Q70_09272 [Pomacea canaliculata]|uniref:G-protein coupled receptors family 2 profile 1 domain-containing protein n=1 Tax=Pomacea canaliculata TaxID=400727 RepID=A0A2T7P9C5_POMCA|nr:hypothetical protein C0Q70_09272 [Pomacea canaliculata]
MLNGSQEVTRTPFRQSPSRHAFHYKAFEECKRNILSKPYPDDGSLYCNATFDNWLCWDFTPAGQSAFQRCPYDFIEGFNRDVLLVIRRLAKENAPCRVESQSSKSRINSGRTPDANLSSAVPCPSS